MTTQIEVREFGTVKLGPAIATFPEEASVPRVGDLVDIGDDEPRKVIGVVHHLGKNIVTLIVSVP